MTHIPRFNLDELAPKESHLTTIIFATILVAILYGGIHVYFARVDDTEAQRMEAAKSP